MTFLKACNSLNIFENESQSSANDSESDEGELDYEEDQPSLSVEEGVSDHMIEDPITSLTDHEGNITVGSTC